jgi:hypothetical protein
VNSGNHVFPDLLIMCGGGSITTPHCMGTSPDEERTPLTIDADAYITHSALLHRFGGDLFKGTKDLLADINTAFPHWNLACPGNVDCIRSVLVEAKGRLLTDWTSRLGDSGGLGLSSRWLRSRTGSHALGTTGTGYGDNIGRAGSSSNNKYGSSSRGSHSSGSSSRCSSGSSYTDRASSCSGHQDSPTGPSSRNGAEGRQDHLGHAHQERGQGAAPLQRAQAIQSGKYSSRSLFFPRRRGASLTHPHWCDT